MNALLESYLRQELALNSLSIGSLNADQLAMFITYEGTSKCNAVRDYWETFCQENGVCEDDVADEDEAEEINAQHKFFWDNAHEVYGFNEEGEWESLGTVIDLR